MPSACWIVPEQCYRRPCERSDDSPSVPSCPRRSQPLGDLAGNLRWSWHPETQDVFASVDPELWDAVGHDPVRLLGAVGRARLDELAGDDGFLAPAQRRRAPTSTAT